MKLSLLMLAVSSSAMVTKAADQTAKLEVLQRYGTNNFDGRFCYQLVDAIIGWEIFMEFSSALSDLQVNSLWYQVKAKQRTNQSNHVTLYSSQLYI